MAKKSRRRRQGYETEEFIGFIASTTRYDSNRDSYSQRGNEFTPLVPRNPKQVEALHFLRTKPLSLLIGPPGTSKTLLSLFVGCEKLKNRHIDKIYYVKPIVDVPGERGLGFLPGDLSEKVEPHVAPVRDSLSVFLAKSKIDYMLAKKQIEFMPIDHLRGRSLHRCMIVADEMQNATTHSVMTILSRLGENSTMAILGDVVQRDLAQRFGNDGLSDAVKRLRNLDEVGLVEFGFEHIERSAFVKEVIKAYADLYTMV